MSKAIEGAAMIGAAIGMGALAFFDPALIANPAYDKLMFALAAGGISMEAGAVAQALVGQRGQNITTRQAAGLRQIVYGMQRLGGTTIYQSTTGAGGSPGNYVYNYVIVLASHEIDGILNLYLDGRRVYWSTNSDSSGYYASYGANIGCGSVSNPPTSSVSISGGAITGITASGGSGFCNVKPGRYRVRILGDGSGAQAYATNSGSSTSPVWTVVITNGGSGYTTASAEIQGAYNFGGVAAHDEQDPTQPGYGLGYGIGPGGSHYDFHGKVYCEARFGDQPAGDIMASLQSNDAAWTAPSGKNLSVEGSAYIYLNVGYEQSQFPQAPEVRLTITGKNDIADPRTGKSGYSSNWALQVADVLTDSAWGLGDPNVNQAQLIAAANVCDELVTTSQGSEFRYQQHIHYDSSTSPGDALALMMPSAAGRLSYVGGEWYIWPAYWQGSSFSFDESSLVETPSWSANRSYKDLFNRVNGTYVAPNYPYSVAGNLYDKNGWYYGTTDNLWNFAWQPTNFPQYAADSLHGYGSDVFLADDGGVQLPKELALRGVISITQAQRVAKIELMRNRQQGSGTFPMFLPAWQMIPTNVMQFTFPAWSWVGKYLEVQNFQLVCEPISGGQGSGGEDETLALWAMVQVGETDPSVYSWALTEELTPYDVPANPGAISSTPEPPTGLILTDDSSTAALQSDGSLLPRLLVSWTPPNDVYVTTGGYIQVQWMDSDNLFLSGAWIDVGMFDGASTYCYIDGITSAANVYVRVRAVRGDKSASTWLSNTLPKPIGRPIPVWPLGGGVAPIIKYPDGTALETLQPAQPGADVTSQNALSLLINPNFANGSSGWSLQVGYSLSSALANPIVPGAQILQFSGTATAAAMNNQRIQVAPQNVVSASLLVMPSSTSCTGTLRLEIQFYNAASSNIGGAVLSSAASPAAVGVWNQLRASGTAPAGAAFALVRVAIYGPTTTNAWYICAFVAALHPSSVDELPDGTIYGRPLSNRLSGGKPFIDLSESINLNRTLNNIADGTGRFAAAETAADRTSGHALFADAALSSAFVLSGTLAYVGLGWSVTSSGSSDIYAIGGVLYLGGLPSSLETLTLKLLLDDNTSAPLVTRTINIYAASTSEYVPIPIHELVTGIAAGSHTIKIYANDNLGATIEPTSRGTHLLCQRVY